MNIFRYRTNNGVRLFLSLLPMIGIIWVHLFLRWHNIGDSIPYFIDEIRHIERARIVWTFEDIHTSTTPSKFGTYYWLGLFGLPEYPSPWLGRAPIALLTILGVAGSYALGKMLFGRNAGLLAAAIITVWPFLLFFERLALTDPPTASVVVITTWWSVIVAKRPTKTRAVVLGLLICLMLAGKLLTIPLMIAPFLAVAFFGKYPLMMNRGLWPQIRQITHHYWPYMWRAGLIVSMVWGIILGFYRLRSLLDPNVRKLVDSYLYLDSVQGKANFIPQNIERVEQILFYHWSIVLCGLAVWAIVALWWRNWRQALFFLLLILPLSIFLIAIAKELSTRYLTITAHLAAVGIAGGLVTFARSWHPPRWEILRYTPIILLMVWMATFGLPFGLMATQNPKALALPHRDQVEYFQNYTGYAVPDAFLLVAEDNPISPPTYDSPVVVAVLRICDYHPYYFMPPEIRDELTVTCQPRIEGQGLDARFRRRYEWINTQSEQHGLLYIVVEQFPNSDGPIAFDPRRINGFIQLLGRFERPYGGIPVEVYEVRRPLSLLLVQ